MTLEAERRVTSWTVTPATPIDHPQIADFLATTVGIGGRKFAADSRDIAEQFDDALPDALLVVHDEAQRVRGYAALHEPHGQAPEFLADFVFDERGVAQRLDDEAVLFEQRLHEVANRFVIIHDQDSHARYFDRQGSLLGRSQRSRYRLQ